MAIRNQIFVSLLLFMFAKDVSTGATPNNCFSFEWQIVTAKNFSSQIQLHPHVLLMITVPWSGESRSLMKEIKAQAELKKRKFSELKFMVMYRNVDRALADALGSSAGITFICYRQSEGYKYHGRLRARNILASVYHLMSLQSRDLPLKRLSTPKELQSFLNSTETAVILFEFCGWTSQLLEGNEDHQMSFTSFTRNASENDNTRPGFFRDYLDGKADNRLTVGRKKYLKDFQNENLMCAVERGASGILWPGEVASAIQNVSLLEVDDSCTFEGIKEFENFLLKLIITVRGYFLPPERHRYGLVSDPSLLTYVGAQTPHMWFVMVMSMGCATCSRILKDEDDLKNVLMHHSFVQELQDDGYGVVPSVPGNQPSVVLFVDRSSKSSKIRKESKLALAGFWQVAFEYQLPSDIEVGPRTMNAAWSMWDRPTSLSENAVMSVSSLSSKFNFKSNIAFMVVRGGDQVVFENVAGDPVGSSLSVLSHMLQQRTPELKQTSMRELANEIGFPHLQNDSEMKLTDLSQPKYEDDYSENKLSSMSLGSGVPEHHIGAMDENEADTFGMLENNGYSLTENAMPNNQEVGLKGDDGQGVTIPACYAQEVDRCDISNPASIRFGHLPLQPGQKIQNLQGLKDSTLQRTPEKMLHTGLDSAGMLAESAGEIRDVGMSSKSTKMHHDRGTKESSSSSHSTKEIQIRTFKGSFFYSDGGYRLLNSLTSSTTVPTVVIIDPDQEQHFVFPEGMTVNYSSLVYFIEGFLNGSLFSYQQSELSFTNPRSSSEPPFVNLDFHDADSIPRVTTKSFFQLILGSSQCNETCSFQNVDNVRREDVLVLFSTRWCGFCQPMQMVVREVFHVLKSYKAQMNARSPTISEGRSEGTMWNELPSIFLMDCTFNDCNTLLKSSGQNELYPTLLLFPAEKRGAIPYRGGVSVTEIVEFVAAQGSKSHHLSENKGILWGKAPKRDKTAMLDEYPLLSINEPGLAVKPGKQEQLEGAHDVSDLYRAFGLIGSDIHDRDQLIHVGSILVATDKLTNVPPFDNSEILILKVDREEGFRGLILNKHLKWDVLQGLDEIIMPLKHAPLSLGGPLIAPGAPLVSFTRAPPDQRYVEVLPGIYFGDQVATGNVIERIKMGNQFAADYWFFLGYSSWAWDQLFTEMARGAWQVSTELEQFEWPKS